MHKLIFPISIFIFNPELKMNYLLVCSLALAYLLGVDTTLLFFFNVDGYLRYCTVPLAMTIVFHFSMYHHGFQDKKGAEARVFSL